MEIERVLTACLVAANEMGCIVNESDVRGPSHLAKYVMVRQVFSLIARERKLASFEHLGKILDRDHSSVVYGVKTAKWMVVHDAVYGNLYARAMMLLGGPMKLVPNEEMPRVTDNQYKNTCDNPLHYGIGLYAMPRPWRGDDPEPYKGNNRKKAEPKPKRHPEPVDGYIVPMMWTTEEKIALGLIRKGRDNRDSGIKREAYVRSEARKNPTKYSY